MSTLPKRLQRDVHAAPRGVLVDGVSADPQGAVTDLRRSLVRRLLFACGEYTLAPAAASCCEIASPIPREAPVTIAVRPVRFSEGHFVRLSVAWSRSHQRRASIAPNLRSDVL